MGLPGEIQQDGIKEDFYDLSWKIMYVKRTNVNYGITITKPAPFDKMIELSRIFSKDVTLFTIGPLLHIGEDLFQRSADISCQ